MERFAGRRRASTLIETLVAIAVIVILAGIAFLGGRAVVAAAKTRSCAENLRQIGQGLALYAHDFDDRYPPYTFQGSGSVAAQPQKFKGALKAYKVAEDQFYCPLDAHARTDYPGEFYTHRDTSYVMSNDYYNHGRFETGGFVFTVAALGDPTQVNVFDDMSEVVTTDEGTRVRSGAHGMRYNVLRADGSVANEPIVQP